METNERWSRWNNLIVQGRSVDVVKEFDEMIRKKQRLTIGDLIVRDQALEEMGVISLSPNAMYNRKNNNGKSKRRKSKA